MEPASYPHLLGVVTMFLLLASTVNLFVIFGAIAASCTGRFARSAWLWRVVAVLSVFELLSHVGQAFLDPSKAKLMAFLPSTILIIFSLLNAQSSDRQAKSAEDAQKPPTS